MTDDTPMLTTPTGFLWGAATSAHQIEGGNVTSDFWGVEHSPDSIFAEPSGDACDSYHRYAEDLDLLAGAGLDAYRFGVEWARVEPEEGHFSAAALDHYRRVAAACVERGVTPMITLHHFTSPRWFAQAGGWSAVDAPKWFARFAARVVEHLDGLVEWVCTINESNVIAVIEGTGRAPLGTGTQGPEFEAASGAPMAWVSRQPEVMGRAHRRAVDAIRAVSDTIRVGWTLALVDLQAVEGGESRRADLQRRTQLDWLDLCRGDDFVGVQTYTRNLVGEDGLVRAPDGPRMQTGWEAYPQALEHTVRLAAQVTRLPVVVTENGMGLLYPHLFSRAVMIAPAISGAFYVPVLGHIQDDPTISNRWLESARNLPIFHIGDVLSEANLFPGQLQQAIGPELPDMQSLESLGYRYKFWSVAADHLLIGTNHPEITRFLGQHTIEPEPFHVTYTRMPSTDLPERGLVHDRAYWVSDIQLRDASDPLAKGVIDAVSLGFGRSDPPSTLNVSAGTTGSSLLEGVPLPYLETERVWAEPGRVPAENKIEIVATNVSAVTIDVEAARVDCDVTLDIDSDGPLEVTLLGCEAAEGGREPSPADPPDARGTTTDLPATGGDVSPGLITVLLAVWGLTIHARRRWT